MLIPRYWAKTDGSATDPKGCPLPPGQHPREDAVLERPFAAWLARYEAASAGFAACRYLESIGSARALPEAQAIVDEHDRVSRARSELPLA